MAKKESVYVPMFAMSVFAVYAYSSYYMIFNPKMKGVATLSPPKLRAYGLWKYLTFHCLVWQLTNSVLHVLAHYIKAIRSIRDTVFVTLTYPLGLVVVLTFWTVWHGVGREFIFPVAVSKFYPDWLNHTTHTIALPINIIFIYLTDHKYGKNFGLITVIYMLSYTLFSYHTKAVGGNFVYRYLDKMTVLGRYIYFACTDIFAYLAYKSGQYLSKIVHGDRPQPISTSASTSYDPIRMSQIDYQSIMQ